MIRRSGRECRTCRSERGTKLQWDGLASSHGASLAFPCTSVAASRRRLRGAKLGFLFFAADFGMRRLRLVHNDLVVLRSARSGAMSHRFSAQGATWFRNCGRHSLNLIPYLGVDAGESTQVNQVRRSNGDGITRLTSEGRLASKDGIGIERIGR
jgi:hypothetical protein